MAQQNTATTGECCWPNYFQPQSLEAQNNWKGSCCPPPYTESTITSNKLQVWMHALNAGVKLYNTGLILEKSIVAQPLFPARKRADKTFGFVVKQSPCQLRVKHLFAANKKQNRPAKYTLLMTCFVFQPFQCIAHFRCQEFRNKAHSLINSTFSVRHCVWSLYPV